MNKKIAIVSIVLIALMLSYLFPMPARGFQTGPGSSPTDTTYQPYGPQASTLWINNYGSYTAEFNALASKSSDWMDTAVMPADFATLQNLGGYTGGGEDPIQLDVYQVDWNNAFPPFNNIDYRAAVSNILQVDKVNFVNSVMGTGAVVAYSPIPGDVNPPQQYPGGVSIYDSNTANIFTGGYSAALSLLDASGIPLAKDMITGGGTYATWNFPVPFPVSGGHSYNPYIGTSAAGYNVMGDGADNNLGAGTGGLSILTAASDQRIYMGPEVKRMLGPNFATWYNSLAPSDPSVIAFKAALTAAGLSTTLVPFIEVTVRQITQAQVNGPVNRAHCYEMYTTYSKYSPLAGLTIHDGLYMYTDANDPQNLGWAAYHDPTCFSYPPYDTWYNIFKNAPWPNISDAYNAQMVLMDQAPFFPYWALDPYTPCLTSDYQNIKEAGVGFNNWWSFLNAYPTAGSPGYSTNTMTYGLESAPVDSCNPISAADFSDTQVTQEIYDTLVVNNPYNMTQLIPYIAKNWSTDTWLNPNTSTMDTVITATLRSDVEWQNIPGPEARNAFTWNNGSELNGPLTTRFLNALDVAFTLEYYAVGSGYTAVEAGLGAIQIDHVSINPMYSAQWYDEIGYNSTVDGLPWQNEIYIENVMGITPSTPAWPAYQDLTPGQTPYYTTDQYLTNFVQFDPSLTAQTVRIYLSIPTPVAGVYMTLDSLPILPMDIFSNLAMGSWNTTLANGKSWTTPDVTTMDLEPWSYNGGAGADLEYGSGPYVLVDDPAAGANNYRLDAYLLGLTYGPGLTTSDAPTITTDHSYFWSSPVGVVDPDFYYKAGTGTAYVRYQLTNLDTENTYTVAFTTGFTPYWYESGVWIPASPLADEWSITLNPGQTLNTTWFAYTLTRPSGATWLTPYVGWVIKITAGPAVFMGRQTGGQGYLANKWPGYTNGIAMFNLADLAGDLAGGASLSPYYGANGVVSLADLGVVTGKWAAHVNWATVDPTSAAARADINGDGIVNLKDLIFITSNWQKNWNINTAPPITNLPRYYD